MPKAVDMKGSYGETWHEDGLGLDRVWLQCWRVGHLPSCRSMVRQACLPNGATWKFGFIHSWWSDSCFLGVDVVADGFFCCLFTGFMPPTHPPSALRFRIAGSSLTTRCNLPVLHSQEYEGNASCWNIEVSGNATPGNKHWGLGGQKKITPA